MKKGISCLPKQKLSRQKNKILMRTGGELEDMMLNTIIEKMNKGGNAKRLSYNTETGKESMQKYNLGGGTHNTYSGISKNKKRK